MGTMFLRFHIRVLINYTLKSMTNLELCCLKNKDPFTLKKKIINKDYEINMIPIQNKTDV